MSKQKTRKSAVKRFKVTKNGKVFHRSPYIRHLQSKKSKAQQRRLKKMKTVTGTFKKKIKKMLAIA